MTAVRSPETVDEACERKPPAVLSMEENTFVPEKVLLSARSVVEAEPEAGVEVAMTRPEGSTARKVPAGVPRNEKYCERLEVACELEAVVIVVWPLKRVVPEKVLLFASKVELAAVIVIESPLAKEVPFTVASAPERRFVPIVVVPTSFPVASVPRSAEVKEVNHTEEVAVSCDVEAFVKFWSAVHHCAVLFFAYEASLVKSASVMSERLRSSSCTEAHVETPAPFSERTN